jgi:sulfite exporter TauE/SafE
MCGGSAVACGGPARDTFLWHAGRATTYAILGEMAGAFGIGTMLAVTTISMGLRKVVMRDIRLRWVLATGVFLAALWSIGAWTGALGGGHMHDGPGMNAEPVMEMEGHPPEHQRPGGGPP